MNVTSFPSLFYLLSPKLAELVALASWLMLTCLPEWKQAAAKIDDPRYAIHEVKSNIETSLPMHLEPIDKYFRRCWLALLQRSRAPRNGRPLTSEKWILWWTIETNTIQCRWREDAKNSVSKSFISIFSRLRTQVQIGFFWSKNAISRDLGAPDLSADRPFSTQKCDFGAHRLLSTRSFFTQKCEFGANLLLSNQPFLCKNAISEFILSFQIGRFWHKPAISELISCFHIGRFWCRNASSELISCFQICNFRCRNAKGWGRALRVGSVAGLLLGLKDPPLCIHSMSAAVGEGGEQAPQTASGRLPLLPP